MICVTNVTSELWLYFSSFNLIIRVDSLSEKYHLVFLLFPLVLTFTQLSQWRLLWLALIKAKLINDLITSSCISLLCPSVSSLDYRFGPKCPSVLLMLLWNVYFPYFTFVMFAILPKRHWALVWCKTPPTHTSVGTQVLQNRHWTCKRVNQWHWMVWQLCQLAIC